MKTVDATCLVEGMNIRIKCPCQVKCWIGGMLQIKELRLVTAMPALVIACNHPYYQLCFDGRLRVVADAREVTFYEAEKGD